MKKLIIGLLLLVCFNGWGQKELNHKKARDVKSLYIAAEDIYGKLNKNVESRFLLNRAFSDTLSLVYKTNQLRDSVTDANWFYTVMKDLKFMALDTSAIPSLLELYHDVSTYMGEKEFDEEKGIYPIGIADFKYDWINEKEAIKKGQLKLKNDQFYTKGRSKLAFKNGKLKLIAPLYDYASLDEMGIVFRKENFYSNYYNIEDIQRLEVIHNGVSHQLRFNEIYEFRPKNSRFQDFTFKVYYKNGDSILNKSRIETPELENESRIQTRSIDETPNKFHLYRKEKNGPLRIKAYAIPGCNNNSTAKNFIPKKPYILVTGFRPPIFGQSPSKTWENYNNNHDQLLNQLRKNGYDIILVKFNMSMTPQLLGMSEGADLLIKLIKYINTDKENHGYGYNENIIQGSSLGASMVRLALIKMEDTHFHNNGPHHHCRLFNSYDANYYGANLPLSMQIQAYSGLLFPVPLSSILTNMLPFGTEANNFLKTLLVSTLEQKVTLELLMYHARGMGNETFIFDKNAQKTWKPTHTQWRQNYLNEVNTVYDNLGYYPHGKLFMPLPSGTRNISISLGKISGRNNDNVQSLQFNAPGEAWRDVDWGFYKHILRASEYKNSKLLFKRKIGLNFGIFQLNVVNQTLKVKNMQEIDMASGSNLSGMGNFLALTNIAYGFNWLNLFSKPQFSHKSVITALAINKNIWPSNGSHTLNMQSLGLMYKSYNNQGQLVLSDHYGYPNLGRPNDHFEVTPFEAVYVSTFILPHIDYSGLNNQQVIDYVYPINDFIKNEVEPCYLYLQNQNLGAQARSNYTYKARRRASNMIMTGHLITPSTDPGDYVVEANADLILEAKDVINIVPGTHFKAGSKVHILNYYKSCPSVPRPCSVQSISKNNTSSKTNENVNQYQQDKILNTATNTNTNEIKVFPNPTHNQFTIVSSDLHIDNFKIYNLSGQQLDEVRSVNATRFNYDESLEKGTYIIMIQTIDNKIYHKKIIIL